MQETTFTLVDAAEAAATEAAAAADAAEAAPVTLNNLLSAPVHRPARRRDAPSEAVADAKALQVYRLACGGRAEPNVVAPNARWMDGRSVNSRSGGQRVLPKSLKLMGSPVAAA